MPKLDNSELRSKRSHKGKKMIRKILLLSEVRPCTFNQPQLSSTVTILPAC